VFVGSTIENFGERNFRLVIAALGDLCLAIGDLESKARGLFGAISTLTEHFGPEGNGIKSNRSSASLGFLNAQETELCPFKCFTLGGSPFGEPKLILSRIAFASMFAVSI